jgi:hypothetical protein
VERVRERENEKVRQLKRGHDRKLQGKTCERRQRRGNHTPRRARGSVSMGSRGR